MDDVASLSGLSKGSLYWHFEGKRELFRSLVDAWFSEVVEGISSTQGEGPTENGTEELGADSPESVRSGLSQLRAMVGALESSAAAHPKLVRAMLEFYSMAVRDDELREWLRELYDQNWKSLCGFLNEAVALGEIRPLESGRSARLILAYFDGMLLHRELFDEGDSRPFNDIGGPLFSLLGVEEPVHEQC